MRPVPRSGSPHGGRRAGVGNGEVELGIPNPRCAIARQPGVNPLQEFMKAILFLTAGGITFLNLEDKTGMLNIIISPGLFHRTKAARHSSAVLVRGLVEIPTGP